LVLSVLLTLLVDLAAWSVWRLRVVSHRIHARAWLRLPVLRLRRRTALLRRVADRWELRTAHAWWRTKRSSHLAVRLLVVLFAATRISLSLTFLVCLALSFLFLLLRLPFFADFFEFFGCAFWTMRLHRDVSIQMIECAVCLLATVPAALVHAFDFFVSPARALVLLCTWDWHEGVDRG